MEERQVDERERERNGGVAWNYRMRGVSGVIFVCWFSVDQLFLVQLLLIMAFARLFIRCLSPVLCGLMNFVREAEIGKPPLPARHTIYFFLIFLYTFFYLAEHPREENPDFCYWPQVTGLHTAFNTISHALSDNTGVYGWYPLWNSATFCSWYFLPRIIISNLVGG